MIPLTLRNKLAKRFEGEFKNLRYQKPREAEDEKNSDVPIKIYKQNLPIKKGKTDNRFPFVLVELTEGTQASQEIDSDHKVIVNFMVGIYDDSDDNSGDDDVASVLNKIFMSLENDPVIGEQFVLDPLADISWAISDGETHPHFFGGLAATFIVPKIFRNDLEGLV